jgi:hypothetical protein
MQRPSSFKGGCRLRSLICSLTGIGISSPRNLTYSVSRSHPDTGHLSFLLLMPAILVDAILGLQMCINQLLLAWWLHSNRWISAVSKWRVLGRLERFTLCSEGRQERWFLVLFINSNDRAGALCPKSRLSLTILTVARRVRRVCPTGRQAR